MGTKFDPLLGELTTAPTAASISDASVAGRALLTAATTTAQRAALSVQTIAQADAAYAPKSVNLFGGGNFVANGLAESVVSGAAPYNFSEWIGDVVFVPAGAAASYKLASTGISISRSIGDALIPVPANKLLELSINLTLGNITGGAHSATGTQYISVDCYDSDDIYIQDSMGSRLPGSALTTLAAPLNTGDTTMTLVDATGWNGPDWWNRQMVWWPWQATEGVYGYKEASGKINMPYTYTRKLLSGNGGGYTGAWLQNGISGNVITLNPAAYPAGWPNAALQAGTPVRCAYGGGGKLYLHAYPNQPAGTMEIVKTFSAKAGQGQDMTLWPGTSKIRLVGLFNYGSASASEVRISSVMLRVKS